VLGGRAVALRPDEGALERGDAAAIALSSWHDSYERLLDDVAPVVPRWHSPLLQTELSREGWKLSRQLELLSDGSVPAVLASDPGVVASLDRQRVIHLPDVLDSRIYGAPSALELDGTNVSLFGEARGRKNLMVQTAAFAMCSRAVGGDWTLHLAGQTTRRPGYARWLDLTEVRYVDHGVLPRDRYMELVASMDAGLAAGVSESYGYLAAEHSLVGVPVVTGPAVPSVGPGRLATSDPGNALDVAAALRRAVSDPEAAGEQRAFVLAEAERRRERALEAMTRLEALL
jgi:hypothetical protein